MKMSEIWDCVLHSELRVHGNGFIQCDVDDTRRLHFWGHTQIPRQKTSTPIHNHVFDFNSTTLKGQMVNKVMTEAEGCDYEIWKVECRDGQNTELFCTKLYTSLRVIRTEICWPGDEYVMKAGQIHETYVPCPTITLMTKMDTAFLGASQGAQVFVPFYVMPDNDFKRDNHSQVTLQNIVEEIINA